MQQKDKRYNNQLDNYNNKYKGTFKLGLVYLIAIPVVLIGIMLISIDLDLGTGGLVQDP